jgi:hypothetical protein
MQESVVDPAAYCREIETYLCRRNGGHLIRIVGPAFEKVSSWATMAIPLRIAFRGIDRSCVRLEAKGPRRRPVRIEHCEADILDEFDRWRHAMGVPGLAGPEGQDVESRAAARRREGLPRHVDAILERLTALRAGWPLPDELATAIDRLIDELGARRPGLRGLRGDARAQLLAWLDAQDRDLVAAARRTVDARSIAAFTREAEEELAPFRGRMPVEAWTRAVGTAVDRLVREHAGLPCVAME